MKIPLGEYRFPVAMPAKRPTVKDRFDDLDQRFVRLVETIDGLERTYRLETAPASAGPWTEFGEPSSESLGEMRWPQRGST
jgi:hypothetical protein